MKQKFKQQKKNSVLCFVYTVLIGRFGFFLFCSSQ